VGAFTVLPGRFPPFPLGAFYRNMQFAPPCRASADPKRRPLPANACSPKGQAPWGGSIQWGKTDWPRLRPPFPLPNCEKL